MTLFNRSIVRKKKGLSVAMPGKRPPNFSWIIDGLLAGCAFPSHSAHFRFLSDEGVRHLVTLTEFCPPLQLLPPNLKHHHIPVEEFDAPNIQQMHSFSNIVCQANAKQEGVAVHCYWGRGRTGTMLAAYLVGVLGVEPDAAIDEVRTKRPYSIETYEQEDAVRRFHDYVATSFHGNSFSESLLASSSSAADAPCTTE